MISIDGELRQSEWNVSVRCPKHVVWRLRPAAHGDILAARKETELFSSAFREAANQAV